MTDMLFRDYLDELRACTDAGILVEKFHVEDNNYLQLYGDAGELYRLVTEVFRNSPQRDGLHDPWHHVSSGDDQETFHYNPGTVQAVVRKNGLSIFSMDGMEEVGGLRHSGLITLHPYQEKKMENVSDERAIVLAMLDIGEFIIRKNLTASFPRAKVCNIPQ